MGIKFGTEEWIQALKTEVNGSDAYKQAAKTWEGDFYFVVNSGPNVPEEIYMYMDLFHGDCRDAFKVANESDQSPAFELSAPLDVWRKVLEKKIDPIQGLMTRKLKLKGNMMKIMKTPKAAIELVECCTRLDTEWPG